ncbi:MAG TPA: LppX_LprAFG lipoprotein [Thermomicrobiales bacterium]|nr:LppX_LprAFG lipoprotein [Thermomicrobiales bacterium]
MRQARWRRHPGARGRCPGLLAALALLLALMGCGGNGASPTAALATQTILDKTAQRLDTVKAVHFTVTIDGTAYVDPAHTIQLRSAVGDIVVPDQMQAKITIAVGAANVDVSLVTLGDDRYQTDLITGRWEPAQPGFDYSPAILFDQQQGLAVVVRKLRDPQRLGDETVNGQAAYHLKGTVDRATIQPLTSGAIEGDPVAAELWVAQDSFNLLKLVLTEPPTPDKAKPTTWTLLLDKYDQPVTIKRPG